MNKTGNFTIVETWDGYQPVNSGFFKGQPRTHTITTTKGVLHVAEGIQYSTSLSGCTPRGYRGGQKPWRSEMRADAKQWGRLWLHIHGRREEFLFQLAREQHADYSTLIKFFFRGKKTLHPLARRRRRGRDIRASFPLPQKPIGIAYSEEE